MALNSFSFVLYFFALFLLMALLQLFRKMAPGKKWDRIQLLLLTIFSYFSLSVANWRFSLCVLLATVWTFVCAHLLQTAKARKKLVLIIGVSALLLMLGYFKYTNFFMDGIRAMLGLQGEILDILLPVGISFYSFSAISYLLDVYWGRYDATKNFLDFALYISFFPKLMSGPIVRGRDFFPQIQDYRGITAKHAAEGLQIFVFGLFKKIVLADRLGVFVDDVFFAPSAYSTATVILAVISFSLQIYFDFSGYSDMAIGIAKMVGFDFSPNFNLPYMATGFSDFWKRWHISLSSWFQEYVYIPLGGSRKGPLRTYINLLIVMLLSGLWHGGGITFLLWGLLHGVVSCLEHLLRKSKKATGGHILTGLSVLITYIIVALLWVPFRANDLSHLLTILQACFTWHGGIEQPYFWTFVAILCLLLSTALAIIKSKKDRTLGKAGKAVVNGYYPVMDLTRFIPLCIFFVFCGLTILLGYFGNTAFIYGQF